MIATISPINKRVLPLFRAVVFNRGSASTVQWFRDVTSKFLLTTVLDFFLKALKILSILNCIEIYRDKAWPSNLDKVFQAFYVRTADL